MPQPATPNISAKPDLVSNPPVASPKGFAGNPGGLEQKKGRPALNQTAQDAQTPPGHPGPSGPAGPQAAGRDKKSAKQPAAGGGSNPPGTVAADSADESSGGPEGKSDGSTNAGESAGSKEKKWIVDNDWTQVTLKGGNNLPLKKNGKKLTAQDAIDAANDNGYLGYVAKKGDALSRKFVSAFQVGFPEHVDSTLKIKKVSVDDQVV